MTDVEPVVTETDSSKPPRPPIEPGWLALGMVVAFAVYLAAGVGTVFLGTGFPPWSVIAAGFAVPIAAVALAAVLVAVARSTGAPRLGSFARGLLWASAGIGLFYLLVFGSCGVLIGGFGG